MENKVFIIGADAASPNLIEKWISEGELPNLESLKKSGAYGKILSSIPAHSALAWPSAFTGTNPGKHGIYSFVDMNDPNMRVVSRSDIKKDFLWEIASRHGKKTIVVNVPLAHPVKDTDGIMVAGFLSSGKDSVYPQDLSKKLSEIGYEIEMDVKEWIKLFYGDKALFYDRLIEVAEKRAELILHLMRNYEWELFISVFTVLDRVQHFFWKYMDRESPGHDSRSKGYGGFILKCYKKIDHIIGRIVNELSDKTNLIVFSDHGMERVDKFFYLNTWLEKQGLLQKKTKISRTRLYRILQKEELLNLLPLGLIIKLTSIFNSKLFAPSDIESSNINLKRTDAFSPMSYGFLKINLRNGEEHGSIKQGQTYQELRDELVRNIESIIDPENGRKVVRKVYRREEIYWGDELKNAPDLILEPSENYFISADLHDELFNSIAKWGGLKSADHSKFGVIFLKGSRVKIGANIDDAHIVDIMPTALYLMGIRIPTHVDGRVLTDALKQDALLRDPILFDNGYKALQKEDRSKHGEDDEAKRQLKALGYM